MWEQDGFPPHPRDQRSGLRSEAQGQLLLYFPGQVRTKELVLHGRVGHGKKTAPVIRIELSETAVDGRSTDL
ncbi:Hypp2547 [Branchiostoma lanceolatum]|uniref:Hypp2547 protein n=1 Tax=Branchiostoma lanceolatum TaxID=7740 RepID=A0A8J9ZW96_BRALA|nr:Hypp2547 [Branchiostoma lanceolatum]